MKEILLLEGEWEGEYSVKMHEQATYLTERVSYILLVRATSSSGHEGLTIQCRKNGSNLELYR